MSLTAIASNMPRNVAGQLSDSSLIKDVDSATSAESTVGILPGTFVVVYDDDDVAVVLPSSQGDLLKGLALFGHSYSPGVQLDADGGYLPGITFDYLRHGRASARAQASMVTTDEVHVQVVAEMGKPVGTIRPDAAANKTLDCSAFIKVVTSGDATDAPEIEIDMTNASQAIADT